MNAPAQYGILPFYEVFYIDSMLFNTHSAVVSWQKVSECLQLLEDNGNGNAQTDCTTEEILNSLQNLIAKGAALSRYFWPAREGKNKEHKKRAEQLCRAFSVTKESPLKNRELRDSMEHFDERLDRYLSKLIIGHIVPRYVGNAQKIGEEPQHVFRAYYTDIGMFVILGAQYKIQPIADEILRLHRILGQCITDGQRLPRSGIHA